MTWLARLYIWATHRLYNEFAWAYDLASWLVSLGHWSAWRRSALDYVVGRRVLEVGFGTGELLIEMAHRDFQAVGLDLSPAMHRVTARKLSRRQIETPRLRGLVQAMPFVDGQFDSILCTFPAAYILDPETLREVARLLRPGSPVAGNGAGRLVVVGMVVGMDNRVWRRTMRFVFGASEESALDRFKRVAGAAGLQVTVIDAGGSGFHVPVVLAERNSLSSVLSGHRGRMQGVGERDTE